MGNNVYLYNEETQQKHSIDSWNIGLKGDRWVAFTVGQISQIQTSWSRVVQRLFHSSAFTDSYSLHSSVRLSQ